MDQLIKHIPDGLNDPYVNYPFERTPRTPLAGDLVYLKAQVKKDLVGKLPQVMVVWSLNGAKQQPLAGQWVTDYTGDQEYIQAELGRFLAGDLITYSFVDETNPMRRTKEFSFAVGQRYTADTVKEISFEDNCLRVAFKGSETYSPILYLYFESGNMRITSSLRPAAIKSADQCQFSHDEKEYILSHGESGYAVKLSAEPFHFVISADDGEVVLESFDSVFPFWQWTEYPDKRGNITLKLKSCSDSYMGFGEKFDRLNQKGLKPNIVVYNPYLHQKQRTYIPIPFFFADNGYGMFIDTPQHVAFDLGSQKSNLLEITSKYNSNQPSLDLYIFFGTPRKVIRDYLSVTGAPTLPPKWAFGPWMSSNSWNTQLETEQQIDNMNHLKIPATVLVLEAWSDEASFYIINDAVYNSKHGGDSFNYSDLSFTKNGKWPNFKGMVEQIHDNDLKLILWQIPVLKYFDYVTNIQHAADQQYAIEQGFVVKNADETPYRLTDGWFQESLLIDFTNPAASKWWFKKRQYLLDDLGVDGFKTDGGEFIFHNDTLFFNGLRGDEMRNRYPVEYIKAYHEFMGDKAFTFSRAGFTGLQQFPCYWGGDQDSSFETLQSLLIAGLSMNSSGNSFWGWDIGGFSGEIPFSELFIRSTEMAAFCPIMQFHSESRGKRNRDRSPWNIAERTDNPQVLEVYRFYANLRMNLLPYIYQEAEVSSRTGLPLMRPLIFDYPADQFARQIEDQYFFGRNLLVAPITAQGMGQRDIYLPQGDWIDFWSGETFQGEKTIDYPCDLDKIPVFVRNNTVIPMNLEQLRLGNYVGNSLDHYRNLCLLIFGRLDGNFVFTDNQGNRVDIISQESELQIKITGELDGIILVTNQYQIPHGEPVQSELYPNFSAFRVKK